VIVGPDELAAGSAVLRSLDTHEEQTLPLDGIASVLQAYERDTCASVK
jgi:histidyl-tRNA synthetase